MYQHTGKARWALRIAVAGALAAGCLVVGGVPPAAAVTGLGGTVVEGGSGDPVGGAYVAVLRAADHTLAGGAVAEPDGTFQILDLAAGSYRLYLIDPASTHQSAFHDAGAVLTVTAGSVLGVDPAMAPLRADVRGEVTEAGSGDPVPGAFVVAWDTAAGEVRGGAVADGAGAYTLPDLPAATYLLVFIDPSGDHLTGFYDGASNPSQATPVALAAGDDEQADAALPAAPAPPATGLVEGTVTETETGDPLAEAWVIALDVDTARVAGGAVTDPDGSYTLSLPPGGYKVELVDPSGLHAPEWYPDRPLAELGQAETVTVAESAPAALNADLARTTGSVAGTVTEEGSNDPLGEAWVLAIGAQGPAGTTTEADGSYQIDGLRAGAYRLTFIDAPGTQVQEYWQDSATFPGAAEVQVGAGATVTADAALTALLCTASIPPEGSSCVPPFPLPVLGAGWSKYTVATGAHSATLVRGSQAGQPLNFFTSAALRRYHFVFDPTAAYVLTDPTQPEDQFDWNKLPGLSDCGDIDLSQNGWMFGWRWRTDLTPNVLEITAYANNDGVHLTPPTPMVTLTQQQLAANLPLWFEMTISADRTRYEFRAHGPGSRTATASLPRGGCSGSSPTQLKWAGGFYFGGTSTAPNVVTGWINENP